MNCSQVYAPDRSCLPPGVRVKEGIYLGVRPCDWIECLAPDFLIKYILHFNMKKINLPFDLCSSEAFPNLLIITRSRLKDLQVFGIYNFFINPIHTRYGCVTEHQ